MFFGIRASRRLTSLVETSPQKCQLLTHPVVKPHSSKSDAMTVTKCTTKTPAKPYPELPLFAHNCHAAKTQVNNSPRRQRDKLLKEAIRQASIYDDNIDTNARQKEISATQVNLTTRIGVDVNPKGAE